MAFEGYQTMRFERDGRVLTVVLDRPDRLNAVDARMHAELARVFSDCNEDDDSDVIVLTGAGRAFCAGGDIEWMQSMIDRPAEFERTAREAKAIVGTLLDCEKPVIAKVNGHATGLGATIALFCDLIYAADTARIGDPHVSVGFVAGDGGAVIWPQLIGYARAKQFLLTGDLLPAVRAAEIGLINGALPAAELDAAVSALAQRLADGATKAIRWTKMSVNIGLKQLVASVLDASLAFESLSNRTADHQEAVAAFRERRPPRFSRS
ncbi:MAG: enoyl-CoA hydratase-related protein [Burkholderiales bacterium]